MTAPDLDVQLDDERPSRLPGWILPAILAGLLIVVSTIAVWLWQDARTPSSSSADAGFARDMTDHHAQAVEMAMIAWQRSEDPEIRQIAYDIATSQQAQIGMMQGWLMEWDLSLARDGNPMAWAEDASGDHDMENMETPGDMPGMLTRDQIDQLRTLDPIEMDVAFLQLMIEHHEGGVAMAEAGVELADSDVMNRLAATIVTAQTAEIATMQEMLAERESA
ncbi:MAG: DUF305 domain-containing protein [Thermomicrobiales bacterium]